jgi:hypothetical protein
MNQIALPFDWPAPDDPEGFLVTDANRQAVSGIDRPGSWPVRAAMLVGPRKSGRSLLGRIFAARTGGTLIDDAETRSEEMLFHHWNRAQETRCPLLIVAQEPPPAWPVALPDLRSRLAATPVFRLGEPDEALVRLLLAQQFARRGLQIAPETIAFIAARIERNHIAILQMVDALDMAALSQHRAITAKLARAVLDGNAGGYERE